MALIVKEIKLEVSKPNLIQAIVAKQNDCNSRFLKVSLLDEGVQIPIRDDSQVMINAERKDGYSASYSGEVNVGENTVTVPLTSEMLELDGLVNCDVSIIVGDRKLTTTSFVVSVEKASNSSGDIISDPQYDVLVNLIDEVNDLKKDIATVDQKYNAKSSNPQSGKAVAQAIASVSGGDSEVAEDVNALKESITMKPEGLTAGYRLATSGWKRVLVSIRAVGGLIQLGLGKRGLGDVYQSVGIMSTGYVEFANQKAGCKPTLYQLYNNWFGNSAPNGTAKITKVRIGYPKPGTTYPIPNEEGKYEDATNPVNCYIDMYVEISKNVEDVHIVDGDPPPTTFEINYFGVVNHHNCYIIEEEQVATDKGMYGEELKFYELTLSSSSDIYLPNGTIEAKSFKGLPLATATTPGVIYLSGTENTEYRWGIRPVGADGTIGTARAMPEEIDKRESKYKPITPSTIEYAVKSVIADVMASQVKELPHAGKPDSVDLKEVPGDFIGQMGIQTVYREDGEDAYFATSRRTYIYGGKAEMSWQGHQWFKVAELADE